MTIGATAAAYARGRTDPSAVAARFLDAPPVGGPIDAFASVDAEDVRAQAAASAHRIAQGDPTGPLEGVLVGVKDLVGIHGYVTRLGTSFLVHHPADDAAVVRRLRGAGAVIAGSTRMTELGLSPVGVSGSGPMPRNPHDWTRPAGGSSSGSAAAVAAGLVPLAVGSDGGGSLRIPPALCGVYGLKPSFGLVGSDGVLGPGWWTLDVVGPIARCPADLALGLAVMSGVPLPDMGGGDRLRVGVDWGWWAIPDSPVDQVCREAVAGLALRRVTIAHLDLVRPAFYATAFVEAAAAVHDLLRDDPRPFSPDVRAQLQAAQAVTGVEYVRAQQVRTLLAESFAAVFADVDVLVTPTTACAAPAVPVEAWTGGLLDEGLVRKLTAYTLPANLVGLPAATVPVGVTAEGLPVGLQLVGARGRDADVLRLAAHLENQGIAACPEPRVWLDPLRSGNNPLSRVAAT